MKKFLSLFLMLAAASALAGQTGKLSGTVVDDQSAPLPGVTMTISSPALIGGSRVEVTGADGTFSFPGLTPGMYLVKAEISGFVTQERSEVQVRLDRTTEIDVQMPLSKFGEEVTVVAETPVVDPTQVSTSQTFTTDYLKYAAVGSANRGYQDILSQAAGVVDADGDGNVNVYGSSDGENAYFVDGLDTTDPVTATFGTNFNFDAIQEISFQTGGFEAEYGRATGGVVNLVTKSGGNEFSGTFDFRYRKSSMYENGDHFDKDLSPAKYVDPSATLGGPIVRDKVWFFLSYEDIDSQSTPFGSVTTFKYKGQNYIGKATWQVSPNWRMVGKISGDPAEIDNGISSAFNTAEADQFQTQGGDIYSAELSGILSPSLLWTGQIGINRGYLTVEPENGDVTTASHTNLITGETYGAYNKIEDDKRNRDEFKTSLTWFKEDWGGSHEFKGGVEYSKLDFVSNNYTTAGGWRYSDVTLGWYEGSDDPTHVPWFLYYDTNPGEAQFSGTLGTAFLQDAWRIMPNLTVKIGVRYDQVQMDNDVKQIADMDRVQPRLGIAWDVLNDAKNLVKASWGRFMHPSALSVPSYAQNNLSTSTRYWSCAWALGAASAEACQAWAAARSYTWIEGADDWDEFGWFTRDARDIQGSEPTQVQDLKASYADELIIGFEREIAPRTSIEVTYVDKKTRSLFDDTCIGNITGLTVDDAEYCSYYVIYNLPGLKRDYDGVTLKFESRAKDWFHILASYTYAKSKGNLEYTQGGNTDFDYYPDHFVNRYGYLADDRRHRVKINGFAILPYEIILGADAFWSSPFNYDRRGAAENAGYGFTYLDPRGDHRGSSTYQLDLSLSKGFKIGPADVQLIATVYNLLNTELVSARCNYDEGCGGDYAWGSATGYQNPRRYEAGFRIEF